MKHSPFSSMLEILKLQNLIGSSLLVPNVPQEVRDNLVCISIGLSKVVSIVFDFQGEPKEGVER